MRIEHRPGRPRPYGVWWNEYRAGHTGRPKQRSEWFATQVDAEAFRAEVLAKLEAGSPTALPAAVPMHRVAGSVGALAPGWLADVLLDREGATHASYADTVKNWLAPEKGHARYPGIGTLLVSALTTPTISQYLKGLQRSGASKSARQRCHRAISAFCTWARINGHLTGDNPAFGIGKSIAHKDDADAEKDVPHPFTPEQVADIFDVIQSSEEDYLPYFQFLHDQGVRPGEAAALKWTDLHLDERTATIARSYGIKVGKDKKTKTGKVREIELTDAVVELLRAWRQRQRQEAFRRGVKVPDYVFTSMRMARLLQDGNIQLVLRRILDAAKIEGHRLYDFRHTFATSHLSMGWERKLNWVSAQLGHADPQITRDKYYSWRPTAASSSFANEIRNYK